MTISLTLQQKRVAYLTTAMATILFTLIFFGPEAAIPATFFIGFLGVALEHPLGIDKAAPAMFFGILCWVMSFAFHVEVHAKFADTDVHNPEQVLLLILMAVAEVVFFLKGALTIVETMDHHGSFTNLVSKISITHKRQLIVVLVIVTHFLSGLIDNMTAAVVMIKISQILIRDEKTRKKVCGLIIIAANAGGVYMVIGDITSTMLWVKNLVSIGGLFKDTFLPSLAVTIVPLIVFLLLEKNLGGHFEKAEKKFETTKQGWVMLVVGLCAILTVPVLKLTFHLPPFAGMIFALAIVWYVSEFLHPEDSFEDMPKLNPVLESMSRVQWQGVFFFIGILLGVGNLEAIGFLHSAAESAKAIPNIATEGDSFTILLGFLSGFFDNIPLMAAIIAMIVASKDAVIWQLSALTTGTGGSMTAFGSAAGVAGSSIEKMDFVWYIRNVSPYALLGFIAGLIVFYIQHF